MWKTAFSIIIRDRFNYVIFYPVPKIDIDEFITRTIIVFP